MSSLSARSAGIPLHELITMTVRQREYYRHSALTHCTVLDASGMGRWRAGNRHLDAALHRVYV